jgi:hypothetical protein
MDSMASQERLEVQKCGHCSCTTSKSGDINATDSSPPTNNTLEHLVEIALHAMDDLSDSQTVDILEQLYGDSFEWGLSTCPDSMAPEEPCTFNEAMASPNAPQWLATCKDELASIQELGVFKLVPKRTADG